MIKKTLLRSSILLASLTLLLTSATVAPSSKSIVPTTINDPKAVALASAIDLATADGKITKTELRNIATIAKGSKLNLKDRILLKIVGNKLSKRILELGKKATADGKSQLIALLLVIFVGGLGIHRFYLGYIWQGIVQLLTLGGLGIWTLIDLIRIIMGTLKPKDGEYGTTL